MAISGLPGQFLRSWIIILSFFVTANGFAQLKASFTVSKEGGCKPLTIKFTNTTQGASAGVTYTWDFGNGNTSTLVSPGATYVQEKTYTITLTARQGNVSSTFSKQVTVYKTPAVDFSASPAKGCMPLEVTLSSTVTPGDGNITRYLWDFGDGQTADGASVTAPKHTYTFAQQAPVSLTVTNSFGCFNTRTYNGLVDVYQNVMADFSFSPLRTCTPGDTVSFQNKSQAIQGTTWIWEFGDGKTGTTQSPKHVYEKEGTYLVTLMGTSPNGCSGKKVGDTVRVGNVPLDFALPESICQWNWLDLKHNIQPPYKEIRWFANDERIYMDYNGLARYYAQNPGKVNIRLEVDFGNCSLDLTKELIINPIVTQNFFTKKKLNVCTIPAEYEFSDTSGLGAKWLWTVNFNNQVLGTGKTFRQSFTDSAGSGWVSLEVTTDKGCTSKLQDSVLFGLGKYRIEASTAGYGSNDFTCVGTENSFWVTTPVYYFNDIAKYAWDFGDGDTSSLSYPMHTYKKAGDYQVTLQYETTGGCKGLLTYANKIKVNERPKASIEAEEGRVICGNTPTFFKVTSEKILEYRWLYFDDSVRALNLTGNPPWTDKQMVYKFYRAGTFNAILYVGAQGCMDTLFLKDFITVNPPFTLLERPKNTCDEDRMLVRFMDSSRQVQKWSWDFGDGTRQEFTTRQDTVYHRFANSGQYLAKLTAYAGSCAVTDSIVFYVLKKQNPVLEFVKDKVCGDAFIKFNTTGFERNPSYTVWAGEPDFEVWRGQYSDGTSPGQGAYLSREFLRGLDPGKKGLRLFYKSRYFDCMDTTNYAGIEIRGPRANFQIPREEGYCVNEVLRLKDSSIAYPGVPIQNWKWVINYGWSGQTVENTTGADFVYSFTGGGAGNLSLEVKDAEGCSNYINRELNVLGPRSSFTASATNVAIGTEVYFTNTTDYYYFYDAQPHWILPDGSRSNNRDESFTFKKEGVFTVKLYNETPGGSCRDTMVMNITVRKVNAQFTFSTSYVNSNGCPPAMVRFTSTATNAVRYGWNFGDGATGGNQISPNHTYNQPGIFQVWHYSYDENDNVDSSFDFIEIKGPYALISADRITACNNLQVTLTAEVKNASSYTWDMGDGTISSTPETKITHQYLTAGLYTPSLILEDGSGCKATSVLPEKIIVDSLNADFAYAPQRICAGTQVALTGEPGSFSASSLGESLSFRWKVANVLVGEERDLLRTFTTAGLYNIAYEVESKYGCKVSILKDLKIEPPLNAAISGISAICKGDTASFSATAPLAGITWRWIIPGQNTFATARTPALKWDSAGTFLVALVADNGACTDSLVHVLTVNELPVTTFIPAVARVCLGDTLNLTLHGIGKRTWLPNPFLLQTANSSARVWPRQDTWFFVNAVSTRGCRSSDSIKVKVVQPFTLKVEPEAEACLGKTVSLSAEGATNYQWVPALGLSNSSVANPVARLTASTQYKVIGSDAFGCFADSAMVKVTIHPLPLVNAGPDLSVNAGKKVNLTATSTLPNMAWRWSPATYLNCADCPSPESRPLKDITYIVNATSPQGCIGADTIQVKVLCSAESIFIANAFTPNGDGLNDRFGVLGSGFSLIKYFRISDRWGKVVFERRDVMPTEAEAFWNGTYPDGSPAVSSSYVYTVQVECSAGQLFDFKGSVFLVR